MTEIKVGDRMKIPASKKFHPEASHFGNCVWISNDGETVALQCERKHEGKNTVFIVKIDSKK